MLAFHVVLCASAFLGVSLLTGCGRELFRERSSVAERQAQYFKEYDSETVRSSSERRKQAREWGFGMPQGLGGGSGM